MKSDGGLNVPPNLNNEIETNFNIFSHGDTQAGAFSPKNVQEDGQATQRDEANRKDMMLLKKFASTSAIHDKGRRMDKDLNKMNKALKAGIIAKNNQDVAQVKVIGRVPEAPKNDEDPEFEFEDDGLMRVRLRSSLDGNGHPVNANDGQSDMDRASS